MMSSVTARSVALTVAGALALLGLVVFHVYPVHQPLAVALDRTPSVAQSEVRAGGEVVQLAQTLTVSSNSSIRDKRLIWQGPPDAPMVRLAGVRAVTLENLHFEVPSGRHATAAIEITASAPGQLLGNNISNVTIGHIGVPGNMDYGIRWSSSAPEQSSTIHNVKIFGALRAGILLGGADADGNAFNGVYIFNTAIGIASRGSGSPSCEGCGFIGSTDVDVELTNGAGLRLTNMYSEGSRSFARVMAGRGGGGLNVQGGYWQHGPAAKGPTITGEMTPISRCWLRLSDFNITPLDGTSHGTIVGFPAAARFLMNVGGVT
jgi:hypothetical protein